MDFEPLPGVSREALDPAGHGLMEIDHLTHNVHRGRMDEWADFYERLFNFREVRYFDIEGKVTGIKSKAMTSPCGLIRIPINEEGNDGKGQVQEYLDRYRGEGIQHIALSSAHLHETVDKLRAAGVKLLSTPDTYYELIDKRIPGHGENVAELQRRQILVDGAPGELLLQIFSENQLGPIFFEFIQRKGNEGFGEGNFKALFESIELDQIRRGVLKASSLASGHARKHHAGRLDSAPSRARMSCQISSRWISGDGRPRRSSSRCAARAQQHRRRRREHDLVAIAPPADESTPASAGAGVDASSCIHALPCRIWRALGESPSEAIHVPR